MINLFHFVPNSLLRAELDDESTVCVLISMLTYDLQTFGGCFDVIHKTFAIQLSGDAVSADAIVADVPI